MRLRHAWPLAALAPAVLAAACTSGPGPVDGRPYIEQIQSTRANKDQMLRTGKDSPVQPDARATFTIPYYDINLAFRVPASLTEQRGDAPVIIEMRQTDGQTERMRRVGTLGFTLNGTPYTLTAFANVDDRTMEGLFVPFGDLTNGSETYGGGRYLNLSRTPTGLYDLDFNLAYHPYCVYNPAWVCPVPPRENRLLVAIPAGERLTAPK